MIKRLLGKSKPRIFLIFLLESIKVIESQLTQELLDKFGIKYNLNQKNYYKIKNLGICKNFIYLSISYAFSLSKKQQIRVSWLMCKLRQKYVSFQALTIVLISTKIDATDNKMQKVASIIVTSIHYMCIQFTHSFTLKSFVVKSD